YTIEFQQLNFAKKILFSGHISENTTWSTDILIKGDVWVDTGVTLTIDAGVNVKFIPNFDNEHSGIDPTRAEFIIQGGLVLLGNDSLPISFTSNAPQSEIGDWYGIRFIESESKGIQERDFARPTDDKRADIDLEPIEKEMEFLTGEASSLTKAEVRQDALPVVDNAVDVDLGFTENELIVEIRRERQRSDEKKDTMRRRNIHYLEIEYAKTGLTLYEGKMLYMKNCAFRKNEIGLKLTGKSDVSIANSVFEDNTIYGIFIAEGVTGYIKDCTVSLNNTGIILSGSTSSEAKELDIEEDNTGSNVSNISNLSIRHSRIINNYDYGIYITNDAEPDLGG
ncbi:right-handed parallel beta-helix repeat-containing protein, partial [candidate division WOR-3 bacterium]|nr:right-handed parallel beta-helix repeat-containing protein [candidate division WOR-3 bacterium]